MPRLRQPPKEQAPRASARFEQDETPPQTENQPFELEEEQEEPAVVAAEAASEKDAAEELKKQIEALRQAEQTQRERADRAERERRVAMEAARAKEAEAQRYRADLNQTQATVFDTGIAKETEALEAAQHDFMLASQNGDAEAMAAANRRMIDAGANLRDYRNGKAAAEANLAEEKNKPQPQPQPQAPNVDQFIDQMPVPDRAKQWLRQHQSYIDGSDPYKNSEINYYHQRVQKEGHAAYSDAYFEALETYLGIRKPEKAVEKEEEPEERSSMVSAPVSREVPSNSGSRQSGTIKLTAAQREAAKMSGVTETEYAKNLIKLQKEREAGHYGEQR